MFGESTKHKFNREASFLKFFSSVLCFVLFLAYLSNTRIPFEGCGLLTVCVFAHLLFPATLYAAFEKVTSCKAMIQMVTSVACEQIFWGNDFRMAKITIKNKRHSFIPLWEVGDIDR